MIRCTKKHRFDSPRARACAGSEYQDLRGLPLGRSGTEINNSGRLRSHRIKLQAGCERRRCDRNSLQKVPQSGCARVRIISPNVSEPSKRELMGRRSKAQTVGGVEGNTSCSEFQENNARRAPLCRGWAGSPRTEYLTVEISAFIGKPAEHAYISRVRKWSAENADIIAKLKEVSDSEIRAKLKPYLQAKNIENLLQRKKWLLRQVSDGL